MLAADLAVAVELKALHTQLLRSEKLAALGELLAGVAPELNNPLTVIMGYGELIGDAIVAHPVRDQLTKLVSEARRMKRRLATCSGFRAKVRAIHSLRSFLRWRRTCWLFGNTPRAHAMFESISTSHPTCRLWRSMRTSSSRSC
jgi:hypothetical protein